MFWKKKKKQTSLSENPEDVAQNVSDQPDPDRLKERFMVLDAVRMPDIIERLQKNGVTVSEITVYEDADLGLRTLEPDHYTVVSAFLDDYKNRIEHSFYPMFGFTLRFIVKCACRDQRFTLYITEEEHSSKVFLTTGSKETGSVSLADVLKA